jgi:hypothetical protein
MDAASLPDGAIIKITSPGRLVEAKKISETVASALV